MRGLLVVLALGLTVHVPSAAARVGSRAAPDPPTTTGAVSATAALGFDLYAQAKQNGGNLVLSPTSLSVGLAMVSAGARGQTQAELLSALHLLPSQVAEMHRSFGGLLRELNARDGKDGLVLSVADRLWGQQGFAFKFAFQSLLNNQYDAPFEQVDFVRDGAKAARDINAWAAKATHNRITDILRPEDFDEDTRLVLTNAVYFQSKWKTPFPRRATRELPFTTPTGKVKAQLMSQVDNFPYGRRGDAQVVELPYEGGLSMLVVLPDSADGLPAIEARLARNHGLYDGWTTGLRTRKVDLQLPRWKARNVLVLTQLLQALGIHDAFEGRKADFSGIAPVPLKISKAVQQAFIEVNETGTEAAAVTAVICAELLGLTREPDKPVSFHADHPFLYILRDTKTGAILFIGRVADPTT